MREKKWTPGEWLVQFGDPGVVDIISLFQGDTYEIAAVDIWCGAQDANARLIAAAPDLVEALEVLHSWIVDGGHLDEDNGAREVCAQAWAALAKAYGEGE